MSIQFYTLCIDGGGTKTTLQVIDNKGEVVPLMYKGTLTSVIQVGGSNINNIGKEKVEELLGIFFKQVKLNDAPLYDIAARCRVVAGMAGVGTPQNKEIVVDLFKGFGVPPEHLKLSTDGELAMQLVDEPDGGIVIAGTGAICLGKKDGKQVRENGKMLRAGGFGPIFIDKGSGYSLGLRAIRAALAEEEEGKTATRLTPAIKAALGVDEARKLVPGVNSRTITVAQIAALAPIVFAQAELGDEVASQLVEKLCNQIGNLLESMVKTTQLTRGKIYLVGGIFKSTYASHIEKVMQLKLPALHRENFTIINAAHENIALIAARKSLSSIEKQ